MILRTFVDSEATIDIASDRDAHPAPFTFREPVPFLADADPPSLRIGVVVVVQFIEHNGLGLRSAVYRVRSATVLLPPSG